MCRQKSPTAVAPVPGSKSKYSRRSLHQGQPPINALLERLDRVRETGPGRWLACCPGHDDRSPSLTVREKDDGRILIHCFAGCSTNDLLGAIGLEMQDLFPSSPDNRPALAPRERWIPHDVIKALAEEAMLLVIAASAMAAGQTLTDADCKRLLVAASRFNAAAREVGYD